MKNPKCFCRPDRPGLAVEMLPDEYKSIPHHPECLGYNLVDPADADTDPGAQAILHSSDEQSELFLLKEKVKELTLENQKLKDENENQRQEIELHNRLVIKIQNQLSIIGTDISYFNNAVKPG